MVARWIKHLGGLLASFILLAACSKELELPPVTAELPSEALLATLYRPLVSGLTMAQQSATVAALSNRGGPQSVSLKLSYPQQEGRYPLLLFSHGNWASKDDYRAVIAYWVEHGYSVLAVDHDDCCSMAQGIWNSVRYGQLGLVERRVLTLTWLVDNLESLSKQLPALATRADTTRIAATGHSFGAFSAQQLIGAGVYNSEQQGFEYHSDARIRAVVAISPPGPMFDIITADSWRQVASPMLVTTGTWDVNAQFFPDWALHKMSYERAIAGDNYALVTQGADHYFGRLICRLDREVAPQHEALAIMQRVSLAFLDAYVKESRPAMAFINSGEVGDKTGGFSILERR